MPSFEFPALAEIVKFNRRHLEIAGEDYYEPDNLRRKGTLSWVLEVIQYPLFDVDHYPRLAEKAAKLAWTIIHDHPFWDGNKRTGMSVLYLLLHMNGYDLDADEEEILETAEQVADAKSEAFSEYEEFLQWVRDRMIIDKDQAWRR